MIYAGAACATAGVSLQIQAGASAPRVTLSSPANGALLGTGTPTYSGSAGSGFGVSQQVIVWVYAGSTATKTPVQTLTTSASGGSFSVAANSGLADGGYTVQAEQQACPVRPTPG